MKYNREQLIEICRRAIVPEKDWYDRDTPKAQSCVGKVWAYLKAGCEFRVLVGEDGPGRCVTNDRTIWLEIDHQTFNTFENGEGTYTETFYLPTRDRLRKVKGKDWY